LRATHEALLKLRGLRTPAFPHKEGPGFFIELKAFPVDGRLAHIIREAD
jgi:hypothetical protein